MARVERWLPIAFGALLALPTLLAFYPPMSDLPLHEGVVGIMRHLGDPAYFPKPIYELNLGHPNQLFHLASWLLSYAVGTRWAVKIVIALSQIAIFHSGARFADHLGRSRWSVLMLTPLALGFTYYWGLVANLIGYSAFFYAMPVLDRAAAEPTRRRALASCAVLVVLFFAHESTYAMATGTVLILAAAQPFERRATALRVAPAVFATVLAVTHLLWQRRFFTKGQLTNPPTWFTIPQKITAIPNVLFGAHGWEGRLSLFALACIGLGTLLAARVRHDGAPALEPPRSIGAARDLLWRFRFEVNIALYLALYFALPFNWKGVTLLHERFLGPAWAMLCVCAGPRVATPRIAKLAGVVLPVGVLLVAWPQFADSSATFRDLAYLSDMIPKGSATAMCIVDRPGLGMRVYSAGPAPARIVADRGGRVALSLANSPISPVQIEPGARWDDFDFRQIAFGSASLLPAHDLKRWKYVVADSRDPSIQHAAMIAFRPYADLVDVRGEWMLFKTRGPVLPIDSPDEPAPPHYLEPIGDRILSIAKQQHAAVVGVPPP